MNVTFNGLSSPGNIITFSDVPNIIKFSEPSYTGSPATLTLTFGTASLSGQSGKAITINGETITSVASQGEATGRRFYISPDNNATAYSALKALRNCPTLSGGYSIYIGNYGSPSITVMAKADGSRYNIDCSSDFTAREMEVVNNAGSMTDDGASKYAVDVFSGGKFITTLEKTAVSGPQHFDVGPVLATLSDFGSLTPYTMRCVSISDLGAAVVGTVSGYTTVGYEVSGGSRYIVASQPRFALRTSPARWLAVGGSTPYLDFSEFDLQGADVTYSLSYFDHAGQRITGESVNVGSVQSGLRNVHLAVNRGFALSAASITVDCMAGTVRYNVIRPSDMSDNIRRVSWRNEYGGVDFFDFTGAESASVDSDQSVYYPSRYNIYETGYDKDGLTYRRGARTVHTVATHLVGKESLPLFDSLNRSKLVWTDHSVIFVESVTVNRQNDVDDVYTVTINYRYSDESK